MTGPTLGGNSSKIKSIWIFFSIRPIGVLTAAPPSAFSRSTAFPSPKSTFKPRPGAADEVIRNAGKRAIPQFVIDGKWVQPYRPGEGFLYEEMSKLLGVVDEG